LFFKNIRDEMVAMIYVFLHDKGADSKIVGNTESDDGQLQT